MNAALKKALASGPAVLALTFGLTPLGTSPAAAVEKRCDEQRLVTDRAWYQTDYDVTFRICVEPGGSQTKVSVENFKCGRNAAFRDDDDVECHTVGGQVRVTKNGVSAFVPLQPRLVDQGSWAFSGRHSWEAHVSGCETGDFYKVFIEDLKVNIFGDDYTFPYTPQFSGIRC
ncbi:hypothetical protein ACWEQ5_32870 [Streptomyces griseoincarnatus]|uniref:hypothetical protein n=1 Tax=unclassified Streptomyces TaxID=2593676 RepID=UPI000653FA9E|nr:MULTISPECIES: hypothetical protein [unclassified Streptomyces]WPW23290.1 hypothetical protein UBV09_33495 [Streptomyces griseoincarnatus]